MPKLRSDSSKTEPTKMNDKTGIPTKQTSTLPPNLNLTPGTSQQNQVQVPGSYTQIQDVKSSPELSQLIQSIVNQTLANNNQPQLVDEQITDTSNLYELDKTPDIVKAIRDFSGQRSEYMAWIESIERIFKLYGHLRGTAKYYGILSVIRSKIIGQANAKLTAQNTPLNWTAIKQCLNTHYADSRDISTLDYQFMSLVQGKDNYEAFYEKVYGHLTLVLNNITAMGLDKTAESILIDSYRNKALDTFIRGLNGDLPRLLSVREPRTLQDALSLCNKLANQEFRSIYAHNTQKTYKPLQIPAPHFNQQHKPSTYYNQQYTTAPQVNQQHKIAPPLPARRPYNTPLNYNNQPQGTFTFNNPRPPYNLNQQQNYTQPQIYTQQNIPSRPYAPKPQPPPEPMDVDRSIRSQAIQYVNRQNFQPRFINKRPTQTQLSNYNQPKQARNFYINNIETIDSTQQEFVAAQNQCEDVNSQQFQEYLTEYEQYEDSQYNTETVDMSDMHFLG